MRRVAIPALICALLGPAAVAGAAGADERRALLRSLGPQAVLDESSSTGTPRFLARLDGFLTRPRAGRPRAIALGYARRNAAALGLDHDDLDSLRLARAYRSIGGAVHLQWAQDYRGIPALTNGLTATVTRGGRLVSLGGAPRPDLRVASTTPRLTGREALRAAGAPTAGGGRASLVIAGKRLAWRTLHAEASDAVYDSVVDATTGRVLRRHNLVRNADALVSENTPDGLAGGAQATVTLPGAWNTEATRLRGDNAHVYADLEDTVFPDDEDSGDVFFTDHDQAVEIAPSAGDDWLYTRIEQAGTFCPSVGCTWTDFEDPATFPPSDNRNQAGTQLYWYVNNFHDHLNGDPNIQFDEQSGNFEVDAEDPESLFAADPEKDSGYIEDRVDAQVNDGEQTDDVGPPPDVFPDCDHEDNANMLTLPDGTPAKLQMYLFGACGDGFDVNGSDDAVIVYHEYTHGLTGRLVTDPSGFDGLFGPQAGAISEALSDWYALDYLVGAGLEADDPNVPGELPNGEYEDAEVGLRTEPMDCPVGDTSTACPAGGYTFGNFGAIAGEPEVHADGEIIGQTLWDLRTRLIAELGGPAGTGRARLLVTEGLRTIGFPGPSFLDLRNAILTANFTQDTGHDDLIWEVFAARGMGNCAETDNAEDEPTIVENFVVPDDAPQGSCSGGPVDPPPVDEPKAAAATFTRGRLRAARTGRVKVRLVCPADSAGCAGRLTLKTAGRFRVGTRRLRLTVGTAGYELTTGQTRTFRVTLRRRTRRLLRSRPSVRITLSARATDATVEPRIRAATRTLLAPRRRR